MVESNKWELNRKKHLKNTGVFVVVAFYQNLSLHNTKSTQLYYLDFLKSTVITE